MNYIEYTIDVSPLLPAREVLYADLNNLGFESIVDTETGVIAYISEKDNPNVSKEELMAANLPVEISIRSKVIEDQNWNATWESSFEPIEINEECIIKAPFHSIEKGKYDVIISPQMSFGTGHHETTYLIARELFDLPLQDKMVLDMGCGTAVLAILAEKLGAKRILAIDNEEWAYKNALENIVLNNSENIKVELGDAQLLGNESFDFVLANINRNVLLNDMEVYSAVLNTGGTILFSGFFVTDKDVLEREANTLGLKFDTLKEKNGWAMLKFIKK